MAFDWLSLNITSESFAKIDKLEALAFNIAPPLTRAILPVKLVSVIVDVPPDNEIAPPPELKL